MLTIIIYSLVIMLASLVGAVAVWRRVGPVIEKNLSYLVSFSAGVFLIISLELGREVAEHADDILTGLFWIAAGVIAILLLFKFLPAFHHHHDEQSETHPHSLLDARRILLSDGLHNLGDGILLTAAFAASPALGTATAISVFIHELVQEISEFFVLRQAGFTTRKALWLNLAVSSTILIGAIGSFLLLESFEAMELPLLGIAAGSFLVVVFHDLIPHSVRTSQTRAHYLRHFLWFLFGLLIMIVVNTLVGDH